MNQTQGRVMRSTTLGVLWVFLLAGACWPGGQNVWAAEDPAWTWMKGAATSGQFGNYGVLGTPAAANNPGARDNGVSWTDSAGALWLFGGWGIDSVGLAGFLNDLWKYDRSTGNWVWMKGAATALQAGAYGVLGTPASNNTPGARSMAASWTDSTGDLWLFGGGGRDGGGNDGSLNDLWKYEPGTGEWTWMKGASTTNALGQYGTLETPAAANTPGARYNASSWRDSSGNLWVFGGYGPDSAISEAAFNDLWKYDPVTGNWAWMKGASAGNQAGIYGVLGTPAAANTPGARQGAVAWRDGSGALWLFGGYGYDGSGALDLLNDLWKYDPASGNWTWMDGSSTAGQSAIYGTLGTASPANTPGARYESVSWIDGVGKLWLFGGVGYDAGGDTGQLNDLWKYNPQTGQWTWMKGESTLDPAGVYGTQGTAAPSNTPGGRGGAAAWMDPSEVIWLFGGSGVDGSESQGALNDLWSGVVRETDPPTGTVLINTNKSVTNNRNVTLSLTWSDGTGSGVVRMKFSNDAVTWTAWEPLAATKAWTLPAGDGYKTVRAMFRDAAGNNSIVYKDYIRLDTTPPTGSIIINGGALSTNNRVVSLGLTWSDGTGAGVRRMRFSIDGAHWSAWEALATPRLYTLPAPLGYYTVRVQYLDAANNYSPVYNDYIKLVAP